MQTFFKHDLPSRVERAKAKKKEDDAQWKLCCQQVDARDHRECRACGRKSDPEAVGLLTRGHRHHIIYRSAGGPDEPWNVCTLCWECHDAEHVKKQLQVEGNADEALSFWKRNEDGDWFLWRREVAVGQFHKD